MPPGSVLMITAIILISDYSYYSLSGCATSDSTLSVFLILSCIVGHVPYFFLLIQSVVLF